MELFSKPEGIPHSNGHSGSTSGGVKVISIPPEAKGWLVDQLPFSVRLRHVLEKLECKTIGELHGLSHQAFTDMPDCGTRTLNELCDFIQRVEKGEFGISHVKVGKSLAAFLVANIDQFVDGLPEQQRMIFLDRLGADGEAKTLLEVGRKYEMTRERVRQIINVLMERVRRFGGPPFAECLDEFAVDLGRKSLPLTSGLLEGLLRDGGGQKKHHTSFYIRIIGWLTPTVSMWPVGQTPAAYRQSHHEKIIAKVKDWFRERKDPVLLAEVYQGIHADGFHCQPFQFLEALRYAAEIEVQLTDAMNPVVNPPIEAPRRWARNVLTQSQTGSVASDVWARAKALLDSRRSPSSRYRLANAKPC